MSNSTKEKIKIAALSLFARRGYDGTTLKDIANLVGIKTPSLYAHFSGKEDLFFSVYENLVSEYVSLMDEIMETTANMDVETRLYNIFEQYIIYYMRNPEIQSFWNQITLFTPPELKDKFFSHVTEIDSAIQKKTKAIFAEGIRQGVLKDDSPEKMFWSYRIMREGILNWMMVVPEIKSEKAIKGFWEDLWSGLKNK